jgi:hypothetical protein
MMYSTVVRIKYHDFLSLFRVIRILYTLYLYIHHIYLQHYYRLELPVPANEIV